VSPERKAARAAVEEARTRYVACIERGLELHRTAGLAPWDPELFTTEYVNPHPPGSPEWQTIEELRDVAYDVEMDRRACRAELERCEEALVAVERAARVVPIRRA
jgi:hypothetical protein